MSSAPLPTELLIKIVQLSLEDPDHCPGRRTQFLATLRLVATPFNEIALRELYRKITVSSPRQLASINQFYRVHAPYSALVQVLLVKLDGRDKVDLGRRGGGKWWRKYIREFCSLCPGLQDVEIVGPENSTGAFFCADWLVGSRDTLECLTLSRLSIASYPIVSDLRFSRLRSLSLKDCRPHAHSQLASLYSHFPSLTALEIENESTEQSLIESALAAARPPLFLAELKVLKMPQAPFLRFFTPESPEPYARLATPPRSLPRSLKSLTLTHVTFPPTLIAPFLGFVKKCAEVGGCTLLAIDIEIAM